MLLSSHKNFLDEALSWFLLVFLSIYFSCFFITVLRSLWHFAIIKHAVWMEKKLATRFELISLILGSLSYMDSNWTIRQQKLFSKWQLNLVMSLPSSSSKSYFRLYCLLTPCSSRYNSLKSSIISCKQTIGHTE